MTPWVEEIDHIELDEAFVLSARVHEATAQARWLEACWDWDPAPDPHSPAPGVSWAVRPSRHLRSLRPSSVWLLSGLLLLATVLPVSFGLLH